MHLVAETINDIRWLRINRPDKLNALSPELRAELASEFDTVDSEDKIRAMVLTGTGRAFCAGGDVGDGMGERTTEQTAKRIFRSARLINRLVSVQKPTIAAVNGLAAGAGAGIALCCDLVYISREAWISFLFIERGLVPDFASSYFLPRIVGVARAKELMMTARRMTAEEAVAYGIAVDHFAGSTFDRDVQSRAEELAAGNVGTMPLIRRMVNHSLETDFRTVLEREALAQAVAASTEEHHQAVETFKTRRRTAAAARRTAI
jgi:2-(1,2-epoxy-1,2-dihydrophenyl)acetyl-CoA isomerase